MPINIIQGKHITVCTVILEVKMAEFNKFSVYGQCYGIANIVQKDKVDRMVDDIVDMYIYEDVKSFVKEHFGDVEGVEWFDYPELNKKVYVKNEDKVVEICMLKGNKQYYGKGWIPVEKD